MGRVGERCRRDFPEETRNLDHSFSEPATDKEVIVSEWRVRFRVGDVDHTSSGPDETAQRKSS